MADVLWFNGRFTTTDEPVLTVEDRGLLFGDAVYEAIKFVDRAPVLAAAHWSRLCRSLDMLEIRNPWSASDFAGVLTELLARTEHTAGLVYLQISRGAAARAHAWADDMAPVAFVHASAFPFPDATMQRDGVGVLMVPESRWARCEIKSVNLLPNVIAKKAAKRAWAHEAVFVRDGHVIEGASSNVFALVDGRLVTRETGNDLLPGTVRAAVLDLARDADLVVEERPLSLSELTGASEAFLTSTSSSVLPITSVDGSPIADGTRGVATERLQSAFAALERQEAGNWNRGLRF